MNSKKKNKIKFKKNSLIGKIVLVAVLLVAVLYILRYAAYFKRATSDEMAVIIQNESNVELSNSVYIDENGIIYLSEADVQRYLNQDLYYEKNDSNMRRYISISQNKILEINENENHMFVNGTREKIKGKVLEKDGIYYFPISELENVYNIEVDYLKDLNRLNIEKLSEEKVVAVVNRNIPLKYKMTNISKDIEELQQGDNVTIIQDMNNGWVRVKTADYAVGYVKKSKLVSIEKERYNLSQNDYDKFDEKSSNVVVVTDETYSGFKEKIVKYDGRQEIEKDLINKVSSEIAKQPRDTFVKIDISSIDNVDNYYKFLKELKARMNNLGVGVVVTAQPNLNKDILKGITNIVL